MSFRNWIAEEVILPGSDLILGHTLSKHFRFLEKSQHWSAGELESYQNEKLRLLVEHSYNHVPFYKDLFDRLSLRPADVRKGDDLRKLPILTKETIRTNIRNGKLLATNLKKASLIPNSSSGSTGEPLQFYVTKDSYSLNIAANLRGWYNMGYRLGDRYVKLSVNPRSNRIKKVQDRVNSCLYFSSKAVTEESTREFVELLVKERPKFIRGYPSTLSLIAKYLASSGADIPELTGVNTTGEILFPEMRQIIERVFGCPVFDSYSGEGGANMFEFSKGKYFVSNEYAITEVLDDRGRAITNGEGEIITTDLWNYANPFIRYAVKDKVVITNNESECRFLRVSRVLGRSVDMLELSNGKTLIVHFFTGFFEWEKSVNQFQVIQTAPNVVEVKLVVNDYFNSQEETRIHKRIKEYIGEGVELTISLVDDIPVSKGGKRRFMFKSFRKAPVQTALQL